MKMNKSAGYEPTKHHFVWLVLFWFSFLTPYREYVYFCLSFIVKANLLAIFLSTIWKSGMFCSNNRLQFLLSIQVVLVLE